jgi:hypothetical protein
LWPKHVDPFTVFILLWWYWLRSGTIKCASFFLLLNLFMFCSSGENEKNDRN